MQEDVGGDVVGEVADDVELVAEFGEVAGEDVGFEDLYVGVVAEAEAEFGGEGAVELDGDEASGAGGEDFGDGAVAGTDLDDRALGEVAEGVGDAVAGGVVDEEVLSEFGSARLAHGSRVNSGAGSNLKR